ncbi:MAG: MopE-related protein [Sandaracinaceae bacterium]
MTSLRRWSACAAALLLLVACDPDDPTDAGPDGSMVDAGRVDSGPVIFDAGPPCETDADCDDGIGCTVEECRMGSCRFPVDNTICDDGVFCNGREECDPSIGCVMGPRETCNDDDVCTIDRCDEEAGICRYAPRDLDEDGDPDFFCAGGGDCDDRDATVNSLLNEVCGDFVDNDCDEVVDESECGRPRFDTCDEPLDVSEGGFFLLDTEGAAPDYTMDCRTTSRDLVATFTLTERRSVELVAEGEFFSVALDLRSTCDDRTSSLACMSGFPGVVRFPALDAGTYFVIVGASSTGEIDLEVNFADPIDPPTNDDCTMPTDVSAGGRFSGSFVATADDTVVDCGFTASPDVFYTFTTTEPQDVEITAQSVTGQSLNWSLRTTCDDDETALNCNFGSPATGLVRQLPAGTYFIALEGPASREVDFDMDVTFSAATTPPAGESCENAIPLVAGAEASGSFADFQNDLATSCGIAYRDVVYSFELTEAADIDLSLDTGNRAVLALRTDCADGETPSQIRCNAATPSRIRARNLTAGTYFVVAENTTTSAYTLNLTTTSPPTVPEAVTGNNNCGGAHVIPETGGLFSGDTSALTNTYLASCGGSATSNDAAFRLELTARSRVQLDTQDSAYNTVLHVHRGSCTSAGDLYCDDNSGDGASALIDRDLDPGVYFVIVDGFGSSSTGAYLLEVTVTPL